MRKSAGEDKSMQVVFRLSLLALWKAGQQGIRAAARLQGPGDQLRHWSRPTVTRTWRSAETLEQSIMDDEIIHGLTSLHDRTQALAEPIAPLYILISL